MLGHRFKRLTIDVAEATCLALLRVMQATSPVDGDVAFAAIETRCTLHTATSTNPAEFKKAIEDRAIVTHVVLGLLFRV